MYANSTNSLSLANLSKSYAIHPRAYKAPTTIKIIPRSLRAVIVPPIPKNFSAHDQAQTNS